MNRDEPALTESDYFQRVERHFGLRRGGPLLLSPKDWQLLQEWWDRGIPLRVILRGINRAFDQFEASGPRPDRVNSLGYCRQHVEETWQEHRELGEARERGSAASAGASHLDAAAAACRAAAGDDEIPADAAAALERVAGRLEELAGAVDDADIGGAELDTAATELETELHAALRDAWPDGPDGEADRRARLRLPRFSPYAV